MKMNKKAILGMSLGELIGLVLAITLLIITGAVVANLAGIFFAGEKEEIATRQSLATIETHVNRLLESENMFDYIDFPFFVSEDHVLVGFSTGAKSAHFAHNVIGGKSSYKVPKPPMCEQGACMCIYEYDDIFDIKEGANIPDDSDDYIKPLNCFFFDKKIDFMSGISRAMYRPISGPVYTFNIGNILYPKKIYAPLGFFEDFNTHYSKSYNILGTKGYFYFIFAGRLPKLGPEVEESIIMHAEKLSNPLSDYGEVIFINLVPYYFETNDIYRPYKTGKTIAKRKEMIEEYRNDPKKSFEVVQDETVNEGAKLQFIKYIVDAAIIDRNIDIHSYLTAVNKADEICSLGKVNESELMLSVCSSIFSKVSDEHNRSASLIANATVKAIQNESDGPVLQFDASDINDNIDIFEKLNKIEQRTIYQYILANLYSADGDYENATAYYGDVYDGIKSMNPPSYDSLTLRKDRVIYEIANLYHSMRDYRTSLAYYDEMIERFDDKVSSFDGVYHYIMYNDAQNMVLDSCFHLNGTESVCASKYLYPESNISFSGEYNDTIEEPNKCMPRESTYIRCGDYPVHDSSYECKTDGNWYEYIKACGPGLICKNVIRKDANHPIGVYAACTPIPK